MKKYKDMTDAEKHAASQRLHGLVHEIFEAIQGMDDRPEVLPPVIVVFNKGYGRSITNLKLEYEVDREAFLDDAIVQAEDTLLLMYDSLHATNRLTPRVPNPKQIAAVISTMKHEKSVRTSLHELIMAYFEDRERAKSEKRE
jgi:hypothetical protein